MYFPLKKSDFSAAFFITPPPTPTPHFFTKYDFSWQLTPPPHPLTTRFFNSTVVQRTVHCTVRYTVLYTVQYCSMYCTL